MKVNELSSVIWYLESVDLMIHYNNGTTSRIEELAFTEVEDRYGDYNVLEITHDIDDNTGDSYLILIIEEV